MDRYPPARAATRVPDAARIALTRELILWCVEAYLGQRGGVPA